LKEVQEDVIFLLLSWYNSDCTWLFFYFDLFWQLAYHWFVSTCEFALQFLTQCISFLQNTDPAELNLDAARKEREVILIQNFWLYFMLIIVSTTHKD
jgi:hypothetical protein